MSQNKSVQDKLLTQASAAYIPEGYVSESLFANIKVKETTGKLAKYSNNHLRIQTNTHLAGKGQVPQIEIITRQSDTYNVERHGLKDIVTPDDYANVIKPYDAEKDATLGLTTALWLGKEKGLADTLTDTSVITQNVTLSGTDQYNDYTNSDPIGDWNTARQTVRAACGMAPDTAIMDWAVANTLAYSPKILSALGYTENRAGQLSETELAKAMGVKRLLIAMPLYNTSKEGQADSLGTVWGKHIVFGVMPTRAMPYQVSLGYYITVAGESPRQVFKSNVDDPPESKKIIVRDSYDYLLSNVNAGYLIKDAIA